MFDSYMQFDSSRTAFDTSGCECFTRYSINTNVVFLTTEHTQINKPCVRGMYMELNHVWDKPLFRDVQG